MLAWDTFPALSSCSLVGMHYGEQHWNGSLEVEGLNFYLQLEYPGKYLLLRTTKSWWAVGSRQHPHLYLQYT